MQTFRKVKFTATQEHRRVADALCVLPFFIIHIYELPGYNDLASVWNFHPAIKSFAFIVFSSVRECAHVF